MASCMRQAYIFIISNPNIIKFFANANFLNMDFIIQLSCSLYLFALQSIYCRRKPRRTLVSDLGFAKTVRWYSHFILSLEAKRLILWHFKYVVLDLKFHQFACCKVVYFYTIQIVILLGAIGTIVASLFEVERKRAEEKK